MHLALCCFYGCCMEDEERPSRLKQEVGTLYWTIPWIVIVKPVSICDWCTSKRVTNRSPAKLLTQYSKVAVTLLQQYPADFMSLKDSYGSYKADSIERQHLKCFFYMYVLIVNQKYSLLLGLFDYNSTFEIYEYIYIIIM